VCTIATGCDWSVLVVVVRRYSRNLYVISVSLGRIKKSPHSKLKAVAYSNRRQAAKEKASRECGDKGKRYPSNSGLEQNNSSLAGTL